jgi:AraC-like DNA-binding protein
MKRARAEATTHVWRDDALGGAEFLRGRFADFSYAPHAHDSLCLAVITEGAIRIRARGTEFTTVRGQLFVANAGELHAGWPVDAAGWSLRTLYIPAQLVLQAVSDLDAHHGIGYFEAPHVLDAVLAERLLRLHQLCESGAERLARDQALVALSHRLLAQHSRSGINVQEIGREPGAVRRAREFLDVHLEERVSLRDLAVAADLPPFRLLRAFTRTLGMSPHAYQRSRRLQWAAARIRDGHPLSEVAAAAGFADQAHLTRVFRRAMGFTPGRYQSAFTHTG